MISVWVQPRLWEGIRVRAGTIPNRPQALFERGQVFGWILCVPLLVGRKNKTQTVKWVTGALPFRYEAEFLQFLTWISSSYIFILRSLFVLDLRPRYIRDVCCPWHRRKRLLIQFAKQKRKSSGYVQLLTLVLSIDCRTPTSELMEDSPEDICLYSSRVAKVSSRITSTSNTTPFSSVAHSHVAQAQGSATFTIRGDRSA